MKNLIEEFNWDDVKARWTQYKNIAISLYDFWNQFNAIAFFNNTRDAIVNWFGDFDTQEAIFDSGYVIGTIAYEVLKGFLTAGLATAAGAIAKSVRYSDTALNVLAKIKPNNIKVVFEKARVWVDNTTDIPIIKGKSFKCLILGKGCFVKDTPVLVANTNYHNTSINPFRNNTKTLALAAAMPIVAVPIQKVQLLDYVVAHEAVNAGYGLTASTDDIYTNLFDKDPYTSDQQRERDEYEINDTDWNEVIFEEVNGSSIAKLALHNDWIKQKAYQVDGVVNLDLSEQGISGPFKITSIKHIIPQKKPVDEDESDDYSYKPVTGLFIHSSSEVWNIKFDNGEELGVTNNHPIFSITKGTWEFAGFLKFNEEVLTYSGSCKVVSKEKYSLIQSVYNLEVKDYHNFLVSKSGVVVHNSGICDFFDHLFKGEIKIVSGNGLPGGIPFKFKVSGVHHKNALNGTTARIKTGTKSTPNQHGYYTAKVEMHHPQNPNNGGWKTKSDKSTFFPDTWDQTKVSEEIADAFISPKKKLISGTKYESELSDGTKLIMYIENGTIKSAFPEI